MPKNIFYLGFCYSAKIVINSITKVSVNKIHILLSKIPYL